MFKTVKITKTTDEVIAERRAVLVSFINDKWRLIAPKAVPPFDEKEQIKSQKNYQVLAAALNEFTVIGKGEHPIRPDILSSLVVALDRGGEPMFPDLKGGCLEHYPEVVERIVEVEKKVPLTRKEALKAAADLERKMNDPGRDVIRGRGEFDHQKEKPRATQAQLEAQATHDLRENEIMGEINSAIQMHRGKSHGATDAEQKILASIRDAGIENNLDNAVILEQIEAKRNEMIGWDNQKAIRIVYTDKFKHRDIDLSQKTPNKYGESQ